MSLSRLRGALAVLAALALAGVACGSGNSATRTPPATAGRGGSPTAMAVASPTSGDGATTTAVAPASPTVPTRPDTPTVHAQTPSPAVTQPTATAPGAAPTVQSPTATATEAVAPEVTVTETATATPPNSAATASTTATLTIVEQGFGQVNGASEAGYGFVVQNPLTDATLESSAYTITALDAHGATVATEQGTIDVVLPGAKLGVGGSLFPSDSAAVASIQVTVAAGVAGTLSMSPPSFTTDNPTYFGAESYPFVTGVIGNPLPTPLQDLAIYALLRDDSGAIIGGGSGLLDFAPPNGMAGVSAYVSGSAPPASVELYPALTASTLAATTGVVPDGARDLILAKTGWGATENVEAGYGFIVKNPNTDLAIQNARYQVVVYDAAGVALERTASSIAVLLPGESLGLAGTLYLPSGYAPAHVEIQLLTGAYVDPNGLADPFTTADVGYVPTNAPSVTGTVANASATDQANVMVYALAYSNDGSIIGGGSTVLQTIVAGGQETVEIGIVANGVPAKVELYAAQDPAAQ